MPFRDPLEGTTIGLSRKRSCSFETNGSVDTAESCTEIECVRNHMRNGLREDPVEGCIKWIF